MTPACKRRARENCARWCPRENGVRTINEGCFDALAVKAIRSKLVGDNGQMWNDDDHQRLRAMYLVDGKVPEVSELANKNSACRDALTA